MKRILSIAFLFLSLHGIGQKVRLDQLNGTMRANFYPYGYQWRQDSVYFSSIANYPTTADSITFFGHSIMCGQNAASSDSALSSRMQAGFSLTGVSKCLGGSGVWYTANQANTYLVPGMTRLDMLWSLINDARRSTNMRLTLNKIINGYRSTITAHFLKSFVTAGNGTGVTRYGTWTTNYSAQLVGGRSNDLGAYSGQVNDSIVYSFSNEETVVVQMIYGDGTTEVHSNSFEIYIDNVLQGTYSLKYGTDGISDGSNANTRIPGVFTFTGLSRGAHKIKLVNKEAHNMIVDFFGHLVDFTNAYPIIIMHEAYLNSTGYSTSPTHTGLGNATVDSVNAIIDSIKNTYPAGYPVYVAPTENYFSTSTGLDADGIHHNNRGFGQDMDAVLSVFSSLNFSPVNATYGTLIRSGDHFYFKSTDTLRKIAFIDEAGGGSGVTTMAAVGSSPNANGASISGSTLTLQPANVSNPGVVSTSYQTFNGDKKINGGFQVQGALVAPTGAGLEAEYSGGIVLLTGYDRTGAVYKKLRTRFSDYDFTISGTTKASINTSGQLNLVEQLQAEKEIRVKEITAPSSPSAGYGYVYPKNDGKIYYKNSSGTEYDLTATGSGGLGDPGGNGIVVRTALNTTTNRTLTDGIGIQWTNGSGVSGNPVADIKGWQDWAGDEDQTTNATITTTTTITPPIDSRGTLIVYMDAAKDDNSKGLHGHKEIHWKKVSTTVTILEVIDIAADYLDGFTTATWTVDASGADIRIRVTGEAATNIDWKPTYQLKYKNYLF